MRCYDCRLMGHCTGTKACKAKLAEDNVEQVSKDIKWAAGSTPKSRTANVLLMALNGEAESPTKAGLIIYSGIYKTLLTEQLWENLWLDRMNSTLSLKESSVMFIPYINGRNLELLGTATCVIQTEGGRTIFASVDIIRGVQQYLLGSGDTQTLGIMRINLDSNPARMSTDPPPKVETRSRQTREQCRENAPLELGEELQLCRHAVTTSMEEQSSSWDPETKCETQGERTLGIRRGAAIGQPQKARSN